jgi:integrase
MAIILHRKDGNLHIHKRADARSSYWVGRTYLNGRQMQKSSGETDQKKAIVILEKWYDELKFQSKYNLLVHDSSVKDNILEFLKWNDSTTSIGKVTKQGYKNNMKIIMQSRELMSMKINSVKETDIEKWILWRINKAKGQGKVLRGKTLEGNLTALAKFFNWSVKSGLKKEKLGNLKKLLDRKLRKQRTQRAGFTKEQYNHLLKVSRERIKNGKTVENRFSRQRLHQFIIFMVGSGLRVDESINLHWEDIQFKDRNKNVKNVDSGLTYSDDERYYLKLNVRISKTGQRDAITVASAHFAMTKLMKLYRDHGRKITGVIWGVKSFREGINALLEDAGLKTQKRGDEIVKYDSKSLRNTHIQIMLDKGISSIRIAKNCGTSSKMIDENYMANSRVEDMLDVWLQTGRKSLKAVS